MRGYAHKCRTTIAGRFNCPGTTLDRTTSGMSSGLVVGFHLVSPTPVELDCFAGRVYDCCRYPPAGDAIGNGGAPGRNKSGDVRRPRRRGEVHGRPLQFAFGDHTCNLNFCTGPETVLADGPAEAQRADTGSETLPQRQREGATNAPRRRSPTPRLKCRLRPGRPRREATRGERQPHETCGTGAIAGGEAGRRHPDRLPATRPDRDRHAQTRPAHARSTRRSESSDAT